MPDHPDQAVPADVRELADARALARAARQWSEADRLRAAIEAAGWKVVDRGFSYSLEAAHPPDVTEGDLVRYGRSASVPSRLSEPATVPATVVLVATDRPDDLTRALDGLRRHAPPGIQVVIVADGASAEQEAALAGLDATTDSSGPSVEVVRTSARLGPAPALQIGVRRSSGSIVVTLDPSAEPTGDIVAPLTAALDDRTVGVAGTGGLTTSDFRHFQTASGPDVDAIDDVCLAFRRTDAAARGPLDERFRVAEKLAIWWSLVLRDEGEGVPPRRAVALGDLPLVRHPRHPDADQPAAAAGRLARRDGYRIVEQFGRRIDLLHTPPSSATPDRA